MPSSAQRRKTAPDYAWRRRRLAAVVAGLVVLGGMVAVTQFASAADNRAKEECQAALAAQRTDTLQKQNSDKWQNRDQNQDQNKPPAEGDQNKPPEGDQNKPPAEGDQNKPPEGDQNKPPEGDQNKPPEGDQNKPPEQAPPPGDDNRDKPPADQPPGGGEPTGDPTPTDEQTPTEEPQKPPAECQGVPGDQQKPPSNNNGFEILGNTCENSKLERHDGFQNGSRCVQTSMGEVAAENRNPTLLITGAPNQIRRNKAFQLRISSRNLVRDRFLPAGKGGYYLESSFLDGSGTPRGHFHVACRQLTSRSNAPRPEGVPIFFKAVEDNKGGRRPDTVVVDIPGLPNRGDVQCAAWSGDESHRIPMMARANQIPAFDAVRIRVF